MSSLKESCESLSQSSRMKGMTPVSVTVGTTGPLSFLSPLRLFLSQALIESCMSGPESVLLSFQRIV